MRVVNIHHRNPRTKRGLGTGYEDAYTHYIGRPSPLGNPFTHTGSMFNGITKVATREEAIAAFEPYARRTPAVLYAILSLPESAILGCYCKPKPCHGDIIIKLWHELNGLSYNV